jgi:uncharacterized protein YerC
MDQTNQEIISLAQNLVSKGDYRQARKTIRKIKTDAGLSDDDLARKKRILAATGVDPYVVTIIAFTFAVWAFLFIKYVV